MSEGYTSNNKRKPDYTKGKVFIIKNTHTHDNLTHIGNTCQTLGTERHNIELI